MALRATQIQGVLRGIPAGRRNIFHDLIRGLTELNGVLSYLLSGRRTILFQYLKARSPLRIDG